MARHGSNKGTTLLGFLFRRFTFAVTLTLVLSLSLVQTIMQMENGPSQMTAQAMPHAEHAPAGHTSDSDTGSHDMSQACFMVCTTWTEADTAITLVRGEYSSQIQFWNVDTRALFRPEMPERPPRTI
ncbi:hypothetical protein FHS72_001888 [Loktanella ponticola]|uniref:DUF2946 domain-containing protein n=1 Tax=Yoonia ponticola TaxID=1524255 RepID=A0A7W9BLH2_9RHOB|nr:hypothetical protein [Yoonia ponticola]MBB5722264.1 hypothetical protein [Yoonia ponticola]